MSVADEHRKTRQRLDVNSRMKYHIKSTYFLDFLSSLFGKLIALPRGYFLVSTFTAEHRTSLSCLSRYTDIGDLSQLYLKGLKYRALSTRTECDMGKKSRETHQRPLVKVSVARLHTESRQTRHIHKPLGSLKILVPQISDPSLESQDSNVKQSGFS